MCVCNNSYPVERVKFDDTILYAAVVRNPDTGEEEHVCGYFNKVSVAAAALGANTNDFGLEYEGVEGDDFGYEFKPGPRRVGNAMLILIPAVPGTVNADSLIPMSDYPHVMGDYKQAVAPRRPMSRGGAKGLSFGIDSAPPAMVVKGFDNGTYDVVIARNASYIASVIGQVDEDKRPELNQELYDELALCAEKYTVLLFCFAEKDAEQAGCALVRYKPQFPNLLFAPGLDGHNGKIERGDVELNHTIVLGHYKMAQHAGRTVSFTDPALRDAVDHYSGNTSDLRSIAPRPKRPYWALSRVIGRVLPKDQLAPQGDFLASVKDVEAGTFRVRRQVPTGWAKLPGNPGDPAKGEKFYITETAIGPNAGAPSTAVRG